MKHIILTLAIVLASLTGFAQEEVSIEQYINQSIKRLDINPGWDVHLIHAETDSTYRVAIVTTVDFAALAYNVQLCNLKDQKLTILENTTMPQGTVVEIEGPMNFWQIALFDRATATADYVIASAHEKVTNLFLARNSSFHVKHYHINTSKEFPDVAVWGNAKLTIGTISGEGDLLVKLYEGSDFQYGNILLNGKIMLDEYVKSPDNQYNWLSDRKEIKTKEVDGEPITVERRKTWDQSISFEGGIGVLQGDTPKDPNSPFLQNSTLSVKFGASTGFKLGDHWRLSTGFLFQVNKKSLSHHVKYENDELVVVDGQGEFQRNRLRSTYLGVTSTIYYYLGKRQQESISLDLYCAGLLRERLTTTTDPTQLFARNTENVNNIFNPWKLEVGVSFNTQRLGFIHGIRVFANLLPEYKPGVTSCEIRSVGIEIKL